MDLREWFEHIGWTVSDNEFECWIWNGKKRTVRGAELPYGKVQRMINYVVVEDDYAHRVAYRLYVGEIPDGMHVRHRVCDNPPCVRPDHLALGSQADNMADKVERGRQLRGEDIHNAKLKRSDIPVIKRRLADGDTQSSIAADYGVVPSLISQINTGKIWKD